MFAPDKVTLEHALVLDFDGTLVDIAQTPSAVRVPGELPGLLQRLYGALGGAVAIVSGRPVAEIESFLELPDAMTVAGVHGAEWRGEDMGENAELQQRLEEVALALEEAFPSQLVERKSLAVAIHYRDRPDQASAMAQFIEQAIADDTELTVMAGKAVFEIKPIWANKGEAVRRLLTHAPFAGRLPVMFGDDVTDEDGFRATLAGGGVAVKVGEGDTIAPWRMASPAELQAWLSAATHHLDSLATRKADH